MKQDVIDSTVAGIPCQIKIDHYNHQPQFMGSPWMCDNDADFYGYTECDFTVRDRRGYLAPWLERKIDDKERERINREIVEYFSERDI